MIRKQIIVYTDNHFDLMWRRCFKERIEHGGDIFVSYEDIEEFYILKNLDLAEKYPQYSFQVETVMVLRNFLQNHPELGAVIKKLYREGRLYMPGAGYCIVDSNLISGESLIRNFQLGNRWMKDFFGDVPRLCVRNDGFGNCPQLPQIMKGVGYSWVTGISYVDCNSSYIKGPDGTVIYKDDVPRVGFSGGWIKYAPCHTCRGRGRTKDGPCAVCGGMGIDLEKSEQSRAPYSIQDNAFGTSDFGFFQIGGEEILPREDLLLWTEQAAGQYDIHFGNQESFYEKIKDKIRNTEEPEFCAALPVNSDLNPAATGCYVSRIRTKQRVRALENRIALLEGLEALSYIRTGKGYRPYFREIWDGAFFTMFHDAVTGTHVDGAYEELMEFFDRTERNCDRVEAYLVCGKEEGTITLNNPTAQRFTGLTQVRVPENTLPSLPKDATVRLISSSGRENGQERLNLAVIGMEPFSQIVLPLEEGAFAEAPERWQTNAGITAATAILGSPIGDMQPAETKGEKVSIENAFFRIEADGHGLRAITDLRSGQKLSGAGEYRPCEFVLRQDIGSPWATLCESAQQICLSPFTTLLGTEEGENRKALRYRVNLPMHLSTAINSTVIDVEVLLIEGLERIEFKAHVEWHNFNNRLCVVFPTAITGVHLYEAPYSVAKRPAYTPDYAWAGSDGYWAACNWAGIDGGDCGIAVFNRGTPAYQISEGAAGSLIQVALLRSPTVATYLHETNAYSMTGWDGMRDEGNHFFSFALASYHTALGKSAVVPDAQCFNSGLVQGGLGIPDMPKLMAKHCRIGAVKLSEKEDGIILRLAEYWGEAEDVSLALPKWAENTVWLADMMEEAITPLSIDNGCLHLHMKPFQIVTLKLEVCC